MPKPLQVRFARKVDQSGGPDACWPWTGCRDAYGYGVFAINQRNQRAHRVAYELMVGPIPKGLVVDHICGRRGCVNPAHLDTVTRAENTLRGDGGKIWRERTHCQNGHLFTEKNTTYRHSGSRVCRLCAKDRNRRYEINKIKKSKPLTLADRFWVRVDKSGGLFECWIWTGTRNADGYGKTMVNGRQFLAHRVAYELSRGPIPEGLVIDHLCQNRICCNPSHIEVVTPAENTQRGERKKSHCKRGHLYDEENTIRIKKGRRCRACLREWKGWQGGVHSRERTHCPQGHEYTPDNTYLNPGTGGRHCRTCTRGRYWRKKAEGGVTG